MHRSICLLIGLAALRPAAAYDLDWKVDGYYRTRAVHLRNLANVGDPDVRIEKASYLTQRTRLEPRLGLGKIAKLQLTIDALDDTVWGDNNARLAAPLFAVNPTDTDLHGQTIDPVQLKRAWIEFNLPVGLMRVGRMPSHWGMGLLANGGGTEGCDWASPEAGAKDAACLDPYFDDDFGDNHFGSINDRILFATRPIQIVKTLAKAKDPTSNFVFAYAYDKLVEDYLNVPLERATRERFDNALAGGTRAPSSDTSRGFGESRFLGRGDDDVQEHVLVFLYNNPAWDRKRITDELRGGLYVVLRNQADSRIACASEDDGPPTCDAGPGDLHFVGDGSFVHIWDLWYRIRYDWLYSEAEGYAILGETDGGVPIGSVVGGEQKKDAEIYSLAWRGGYSVPALDALLEVGYASGDKDPFDGSFTQRPVHPDYNVGLILYEEVLRELTARTIGRFPALNGYVPNSRSLQSNGGVINSRYLNPRIKFRPQVAPGLELLAGVLAAWVDTQGFTPVWPTENCAQGEVTCDSPSKVSKFLGWEVDLGLKYWWADEHLFWTLEGGYLRFGDALRRAFWDNGGTNAAGSGVLRDEVKGAATIQSRLAFVF